MTAGSGGGLPEAPSDLKAVKSSGLVPVQIKYENLKQALDAKHTVKRMEHADDWKSWSSTNRLEMAWLRTLRGKGKGTPPFPVEEKKIPSGSGQVDLKWTVWCDSEDLENNEVELYSVMRAEERYIKLEFRKLASKFFFDKTVTRNGKPFKFPIENCGVDSFFKSADGQRYVVCESKFTRDEGLFAKWKEAIQKWEASKTPPKKVWGLLPRSGKMAYRQMSWKWIKDRAIRAEKKPAGTASVDAATRKAIKRETSEMSLAVRENPEGIERVINVYGAARVPIYPGRYQVKVSRRKMSSNVLHLKWTLDIESDEFMVLGTAFDDWSKGLE